MQLRDTLRRRVAVCCVVIGGLLLWGAPARAALVHPFVSQLTETAGKEPELFSPELCGVNVDPGSGDVLVADPGALQKEQSKPAIDVFSTSSAFVGKIDKGPAEFTFHEACSSAVNDTSHKVYVANDGEANGEEEGQNEAVFVYSDTGGKFSFLKGSTIDGSNTPAKSFKNKGAGDEIVAGGPLHVAVAQKSEAANSEDVYVSVAEQGVVDEFNAKGEYQGQLTFPGSPAGAPGALTTDSNGDVYVSVRLVEKPAHVSENGTSVDVIDEFNPSGQQLKQIAVPSGGLASPQTIGVAVDAAGHVYASDSLNRVVDEFDSAGRFMGQLTGAGTPRGGFLEPMGVSVNAEGKVYVADRSIGVEGGSPSVVDVFGPATPEASPFLESEAASNLTSSTATLDARIDPTGLPTKYHFEYDTSEYNSSAKHGTELPAAEAEVSGESIYEASVQLEGLAPSTEYHYRAVVTNSHGTERGPDQTFTTQPTSGGLVLPDGRAWELVSPPNKHGALIQGIGSIGVIQAAQDGSAVAYSAATPVEANVGGSVLESPLLSTRGAKEWSTRDIKPPENLPAGGSKIGTFGLETRLFSSDLSHALVQPFLEEPLLSPEASERTPYLRNETDIACEISQTTCYLPLVTGKEGYANVPAGTKFGGKPEETFGAVTIESATPDLSHVVLRSRIGLTPGSPGGLYEWTKEKPPGEQLQFVSVLPKGGAATHPALGFEREGAEGGQPHNIRKDISSDGSRIIWTDTATGHLYMRDTARQETIQLDAPAEGAVATPPVHAIVQVADAQGSRVFFTDTQRLTSNSKAEPPSSPTLPVGKPDLFEFDLNKKVGQQLTDLTPEGTKGESADIQGAILGAGEENGSLNVYFVANGVMTSSANAEGEKARPGTCGALPPLGATCNLYVEHYNGQTAEGPEGPVFIASLSSDDGPDWGTGAEMGGNRFQSNFARAFKGLTSQVSPNGEYVTFMSDRRLTGYDNTDVNPSSGGAADEEVFLYHASSRRLLCASCNPGGARPQGVLDVHNGLVIDRKEVWRSRWLAGSIPGWNTVEENNALYQSHYLSNSGRLFFNSADALVPQDTNRTEDVYEYEPEGVPTASSHGCARSDARFSARAEGCIALISSGTSSEESAFLDASESGGDVFFVTAAQLTPQDFDQSFDVYDAHECTAKSPCLAPPQPPPAPCSRPDACKGPPSPPTIFGAPASATPSGAGNFVPQQEARGVRVSKPTRAQELARALKACRRKPKKQRAACEARARKKYGARKAKKAKPRRSVSRRGGRHARAAK